MESRINLHFLKRLEFKCFYNEENNNCILYFSYFIHVFYNNFYKFIRSIYSQIFIYFSMSKQDSLF